VKLFIFIDSRYPEILTEIREKKSVSEELEKKLTQAVEECKKA